MTAATTFDDLAALSAGVGHHLGYSEWLEIDQARIDRFADATGDHQWIHVDPERAAAGPYGATIAHGYLTMSLVAYLLPQIVAVHGISMGINYGADKLRFPSPVRVGSRVRAGAELIAAVDVAGGVQTTMRVTIEIEGGAKPACVVDSLARYIA